LPPIVDISNFSKSYGAVAAVRDISLSVERGELFGLLGPDGAGKTTTMRTMVTLLRPDSGSITVDGHRSERDLAAIRKITGYMPQRFSLYPDLSVDQNLNFFAELFTVPRSEIAERKRRLYEFSRLEPFAKRLAGRLSGGMKQKLALSCTLIHDPVILVLDEPTTGVDPVSRNEFWSILRSLKDQGVTIFVSTPYMDEAAYCDRIAIMHQGRILAQGAPASFPEMIPEHVFLLADARPADADVLRNMSGAVSAHAFGDSIHVTMPPETSEASANDAVSRAIGRPANLKRIPPSLEDVFISLIRGARDDD
jgi:ABC-2 type transport system ATP-binding protein